MLPDGDNPQRSAAFLGISRSGGCAGGLPSLPATAVGGGSATDKAGIGIFVSVATEWVARREEPVSLQRIQRVVQAQRRRGRAFQPRFSSRHVLASWLGALVAISILGLISLWSGYGLVVAPFGASSVLLFGHPESPLAQPRNLVLGNTLAALIAIL